MVSRLRSRSRCVYSSRKAVNNWHLALWLQTTVFVQQSTERHALWEKQSKNCLVYSLNRLVQDSVSLELGVSPPKSTYVGVEFKLTMTGTDDGGETDETSAILEITP